MLKFDVEGMSCGHCVQAVTRAVHLVDPKAEVAVDLAGKTVAVESGGDPGQFAAAVEQAGYSVKAVANGLMASERGGCGCGCG